MGGIATFERLREISTSARGTSLQWFTSADPGVSEAEYMRCVHVTRWRHGWASWVGAKGENRLAPPTLDR